MVKARFVFFRSLQPLLKYVYPGTKLTLLAVFLGTGISPAFSLSNSRLARDIPSTQSTVREQSNHAIQPVAHGHGLTAENREAHLREQPLTTVYLQAPEEDLIAQVLLEPPTGNVQQLVRQGRELYEAGRFADAVIVLQQAASASEAGDIRRAVTLSNLSLTYQQLGLWSQADQAITDSLKLLQVGQNVSTGRLQLLGQVLDIQGRLQLSLGQAELALTTWQQAAATYTQAGDNPGLAGSLINQAQALQALGLYRQALTKLTQVNQTLKEQPNSLIKAAGLRGLGNALYGISDLDQSRQILQQSLAMAQQLQSTPDIGAALFSLGNLARAQQDTQAALAFYQRAASTGTSRIAPTLSSQDNQLQAELNQLSLLLETKQWSAAQALWPQIRSQITNLPASRTGIYARINFAQSLMKLKAEAADSSFTPDPSFMEIARLVALTVQQAKSLKDQRAEAYALGSLGELYEQTQQWSSAQDLTQQALLLAQAINASDITYRLQWQLGRLLKAQGDRPGAIAAYTETVNTLQSLRNDLVASNPDVQFSFRDSVEPVYRQLVGLLLESEAASRPTQQNLVQARKVIESLQLAELENFFRAACLDTKPVLIDKLVDQDNPTVAVIYPIILADRLEVILKIPRQPLRHHTISGLSQSDAERTVTQLRQKLTEPDATRAVRSLSQQVYSWLIQPAEAELNKTGVKTLAFVLDGPLRNIPMAALYDGEQYLVEKYAVALSPGLQLLNPNPLPQGRLKALTAGLTEPPRNFQNFSTLLAVKSEFNLIQQAGVSASQLLDQQFTSKTLEKEINSAPFNVIHLATHGQFSSRAKDTFILASDGPINVNQLDNLLRARGRSRPEAIELLVLSACETAAGDNRAALGLAGVAVRAGARSTLASLWQIDDESTAVFVGEFYRELANTKVTKAEALRRAQVTLLKQYPNYSRPGYWAPYVLVGNWL